MPTLQALPQVLESVAGRLPVLVDGGVRRGSDIAKALALGAQGVLLGRATLYGAVADGDAGAQRALYILHDELLRTQRLCGAPSVNDLGPELLRPWPALPVLPATTVADPGDAGAQRHPARAADVARRTGLFVAS